MTTKRKQDGTIAKTPAERQAERRARGAGAILLPGPVLAHLDKVASNAGDKNRVACLTRIIANEA